MDVLSILIWAVFSIFPLFFLIIFIPFSFFPFLPILFWRNLICQSWNPLSFFCQYSRISFIHTSPLAAVTCTRRLEIADTESSIRRFWSLKGFWSWQIFFWPIQVPWYRGYCPPPGNCAIIRKLSTRCPRPQARYPPEPPVSYYISLRVWNSAGSAWLTTHPPQIVPDTQWKYL